MTASSIPAIFLKIKRTLRGFCLSKETSSNPTLISAAADPKSDVEKCLSQMSKGIDGQAFGWTSRNFRIIVIGAKCPIPIDGEFHAGKGAS